MSPTDVGLGLWRTHVPRETWTNTTQAKRPHHEYKSISKLCSHLRRPTNGISHETGGRAVFSVILKQRTSGQESTAAVLLCARDMSPSRCIRQGRNKLRCQASLFGRGSSIGASSHPGSLRHRRRANIHGAEEDLRECCSEALCTTAQGVAAYISSTSSMATCFSTALTRSTNEGIGRKATSAEGKLMAILTTVTIQPAQARYIHTRERIRRRCGRTQVAYSEGCKFSIRGSNASLWFRFAGQRSTPRYGVVT